MIRPVRVAWEYYDACPTCRVKKTERCIRKTSVGKAKLWRSDQLDRPHQGRPRHKKPLRPIGAHRSDACRHWHPAVLPGVWPCSRREHADPNHAHVDIPTGDVVHWTATEQLNHPEHTPRHLREDTPE